MAPFEISREIKTSDYQVTDKQEHIRETSHKHTSTKEREKERAFD